MKLKRSKQQYEKSMQESSKLVNLTNAERLEACVYKYVKPNCKIKGTIRHKLRHTFLLIYFQERDKFLERWIWDFHWIVHLGLERIFLGKFRLFIWKIWFIVCLGSGEGRGGVAGTFPIFSHLIFSRFIIFTFRNYFTLCKILCYAFCIFFFHHNL